MASEIIHEDTILTPDENSELTKSIENYKKGKTISFDKLKSEIGKYLN